MSQENLQTMIMQNLRGVKEAYYGVVQVVNINSSKMAHSKEVNPKQMGSNACYRKGESVINLKATADKRFFPSPQKPTLQHPFVELGGLHERR